MAICFVLHVRFSRVIEGCSPLSEEKNAANDADGKDVAIKKVGVFQMGQTPVLLTQALGHYEQNPQSRRKRKQAL